MFYSCTVSKVSVLVVCISFPLLLIPYYYQPSVLDNVPKLFLLLGSGSVAQLVERLLLIPEVRSLNPVIGKNLFILNICLLSTVY